MWQRAATSSRRSPLVRRRCPRGRPTSSGCSDSRRRRRNSASPARSIMAYRPLLVYRLRPRAATARRSPLGRGRPAQPRIGRPWMSSRRRASLGSSTDPDSPKERPHDERDRPRRRPATDSRADDEPVSVALRPPARRLERSGGRSGSLVAAAPTVAFVVADAARRTDLGVHRPRRDRSRGVRGAPRPPGVRCGARWSASPWPPSARCVAALSGEARAFFLLPTLLPAVLVLVFLGSVLVRRPLTGTLVQPHGRRAPRLAPALPRCCRVYTITTLVAVAIHAVNFVRPDRVLPRRPAGGPGRRPDRRRTGVRRTGRRHRPRRPPGRPSPAAADPGRSS